MCVKIFGEILMVMGNWERAIQTFELLRNLSEEVQDSKSAS